MNRKQYEHLPKHIQARAEEYLAAAMMNMESAEVIASEIASFTDQLRKGTL